MTYPEPYGVNRIQIPTDDEIHRVHVKGINVSNFFNRNHTWKIHPDWYLNNRDEKQMNGTNHIHSYFHIIGCIANIVILHSQVQKKNYYIFGKKCENPAGNGP